MKAATTTTNTATSSAAQRLGLPAISERLQHVVVLMLENRSFDHMCGYLKQVEGNIDGLTGKETCPYDPRNPSLGSVQVSNDSPYLTPVDPDHGYVSTREQIFGYSSGKPSPAPMSGFVLNYNQDGETADRGAMIMKCFNPSNVPAISTLVTEFGVCDRWYSSLPGPTQPNRMFLHSATSYGATSNDDVLLAEGYPQKTIYDSLWEAGLSWRVYFHDFPAVLFLKNLRSPDYLGNILPFEEFYSAAASGELPAYTFLEPRWFNIFDWMASDEHPPHDVRYGEYLLADVYEALRNGPKWNNTLFIVTYDEHGGFYDHVPPPQEGVPAPDDHRDSSGFTFDRLGVRVPAVFISPWINKGVVYHEPATGRYEHSSVAATLKKVYGLPSFLTKRDAWAATFESFVADRTAPRTDCPTTVPRPGPVSMQEQWRKYSGPITPEGIKEGIDNDRMSKAPITDLQSDIISIAQGLDGVDDESCLEAYLSLAEEQLINTEHHGSIFVQRQIRRFLEKHRRTRQEKGKAKE